MKAYNSLSEACKAVWYRKKREILAIVSFNGQLYFIQKSSPTPEMALTRAARQKIYIRQELQKLMAGQENEEFETLLSPSSSEPDLLSSSSSESSFNSEENEGLELDTTEQSVSKFNNRNVLLHYFKQAGVHNFFTKPSRHAEEELIINFPQMLTLFQDKFPTQLVKTIEVILTHSPCTKQGERPCSSPKTIHNFQYPQGCDEKLRTFFKNIRDHQNKENLFHPNISFRVRYVHEFNNTLAYDQLGFIRKCDPLLQEKLQNCQHLSL